MSQPGWGFLVNQRSVVGGSGGVLGHAEWRAGPCPIQTRGLGILMYTVSGLREVIADAAPTL